MGAGLVVHILPVPVLQKFPKTLLAPVVWLATSAEPALVGAQPQRQEDPVWSHLAISITIAGSELFGGIGDMGRVELSRGVVSASPGGSGTDGGLHL